jgi:DNA-binding transcriptional LysR family regulator
VNDLRRVDLNLLVTLEALLTERSVTRAAKRLHLSQPSVSVQLRKLRELFSDELLSTAPGGMVPTVRGQALLQPLRDVLSGTEQLLNVRAPFNPGSAEITWHIAAADYAEYVVLLPLLAGLRKVAPGVRVAIREAGHARVIRQMESGAIDLGFVTLDDAPDRMHSHVLFEEHYVLVSRKGHPALKRKPTLAQFCELDFVLVSPDGGGFRGITDTMLESRGRKRRVVTSVPHFLFVPELLKRTNLVALLPRRLVKDRKEGLQVLEPPLAIPSYQMAMIWHERSHRDPAHQWLRSQVIAAVGAS